MRHLLQYAKGFFDAKDPRAKAPKYPSSERGKQDPARRAPSVKSVKSKMLMMLAQPAPAHPQPPDTSTSRKARGDLTSMAAPMPKHDVRRLLLAAHSVLRTLDQRRRYDR